MVGRRLAVAACAALMVTPAAVPAPALAGALTSGEAFGVPGAGSRWAPSTNSFVGTARNATSKVWFTGFDGIVGAVFWPTPDTPNSTDLQFMVGDGARTWVDEEKADTTHTVAMADPRALIWRVTNTDRDGRYRIRKTIYTDPARNTLVQEVTFTALTGRVGDYVLYPLYNPAISNSGDNDTARTVTVSGRTYLEASDPNGRASVLASSLPIRTGMAANGFVGRSDGWTDLRDDRAMSWTYDSATRGNVAQMAQLDWGAAATQTSATFRLVLGFGTTASAAQTAADGTLASDPATLSDRYVSEWSTWLGALTAIADPQYTLALMTVKAHQDKAGGGIVAGLGNPWGPSQGDGSNGGYHLVWARDLYHKASALLAAGDATSATAAVDWLFYRQQRSDGSFPQNSWLDGTPYWTGTQLDQTADAILLAYKAGRTGATFYANEIRPAADFLLREGARTGQERWEEAAGFSPATIAATVAGLVAAARIAEINGDTARRDHYGQRADDLQALVPSWTFTTTGPHGDGRYFERIDDWGDPDDGHALTIANGGGTWDERSILDAGFLELVRLGVRPPDDPYVAGSLPETDAVLKQTIAGKGDYWFRYNHDGYGETATGGDFTGAGIGRLWPIFSGERGHYVVARGGDAGPYLTAMRTAANGGGMIPEQVWDRTPPAGATPGTPTRSMTPLGWSMAEYATLALSRAQGRVADQTTLVRNRYAFRPDLTKRLDWQVARAVQGRGLTLYYNGPLKGSARVTLHWGFNGWTTIADKAMIRRADGAWEVGLSVPIDATTLDLAFTDGASWDANGGGDYHVPIAARSPAPYSVPVDLVPSTPVKGQRLTVFYKGALAASSTKIWLHHGYDGWAAGTVADAAMTRRGDGFWSVTLTMPTNRSRLDLAFVNQAGAWDANGGRDWHFGVTRR